jgi:Fic family protein
VAREAEQTARRIVEFRESVRHQAQSAGMSANMFTLIDWIFEQPMITVNAARDHLGVSFPAANTMINELRRIGLISEVTGGRRNRMFRFDPYLDLFADVTEASAENIAQPQPTLH